MAETDRLVIGSGSGNEGATIYSGSSSLGAIYFADGTTGDTRYRGYMGYQHNGDYMYFGTAASERMRIDSSGNLLVGTTVAVAGSASGVQILPSGFIRTGRGATTGELHHEFYNPNGRVGYIATSGTTTSYVTSSDYRLKTDAQPMTGASDRVLALKPVNFAWKADGSRVDGFLAHEAQAVVPEAVTGEKDAVDAEGNPEYQGIDQSKLVPLLTAALQEALTEIADLKARVAALEA